MMKANADVPFYSQVKEAQVLDWVKTYFFPYVKTEKICYDTSGCWHMQATYNLAGDIAKNNRTMIGVGINIISAKLANGTNLIFDAWRAYQMYDSFRVKVDSKDNNENRLLVYIDANGDSPPNVIGKDIYIAVFTSNGLVPAGNNADKDEIDKNCSKNATGTFAGYYCLKKVQQSGWEISNEVWNK